VAKLVFLDTNVYLHYQSFDQINWLKTLKASEATIVVPPITIRELGKHKELHPRQRVRDRAGAVLKKLLALFESGYSAALRDGVQILLEDREPMIDFTANQLSHEIQDDQLIASIIMFKNERPGAEIMLVTSDAGLTLIAKARRHSIQTAMLPDNLKVAEEPDSSQVRIRELEQKIRVLELKAPQLSLVFADGSQHATFILPPPVQLTKEDVATKMELVHHQYPKLQRQSDQTNVSAEPLASVGQYLSALSAAIGNVLQPEDIDSYNKELDKFYEAYSEYLLHEVRYENLRRRKIELLIFATNDGTAPAEDVDVFLHFPDGFEVTDGDSFPDAPPSPEPPAKPRTRLQYLAESVALPSLDPSLLINRIPDVVMRPPQNVSTPNIKRTSSYEVDFHIERIKHRLQEPASPLYIVFESFESAHSFTIEYRLLAANIPDTVIGQLHVVIGRQ